MPASRCKNFWVSKISVDEKVPCNCIKNAIDALKQDETGICVLPIENSVEGIVRETIDNLLKLDDNSIQIQGEILLNINHMLLSSGKNIAEIKEIISHPQALAQCSNNLYKLFPRAQLKETSSTSYAALKVSREKNPSVAAIANEACAKLFNLNILIRNLNDEKGNKTRFYILGRSGFKSIQSGKTAIVLSTKNVPGALCNVLKVFSDYEINLSYIDSRPSKKQLGEYLFFMELDKIITDTSVQHALEYLKSYVDFLKVLGSFKTYS